MADQPDNPPVTSDELLTRQFYDWEVRGRGWQLWESPVELEPPFRPFWFHEVVSASPVTDDARHETLVSGWVQRVKNAWKTRRGGSVSPSAPDKSAEAEEPLPELFTDESPLVEMSVTLSREVVVSRDAAEQFVLSLHYAHAPFSFELVGSENSIQVLFACRERDTSRLGEQLRSYFSGSVIRSTRGLLNSFWLRKTDRESLIVDFGLSHEFMLPLRTHRTFEVDPLIALTGAMGDLGK